MRKPRRKEGKGRKRAKKEADDMWKRKRRRRGRKTSPQKLKKNTRNTEKYRKTNITEIFFGKQEGNEENKRKPTHKQVQGRSEDTHKTRRACGG